MAPVGERLAALSDLPVVLAGDVAGPEARRTVAAAREEVVLLENTRFEPGETVNDPELADRLAGLADVFVMDAFGAAHRAHASTVGVAQRLSGAAGPLLLGEVAAFDRILHPDRPLVVLLGGAKVSSKIGVIEALLPQVDAMLVGGAMCFTLLAAGGRGVGRSPVETEMVDRLSRLLSTPEGAKLVLPSDVVVGEAFAADTPYRIAKVDDIPDEGYGLDVGPDTVERFTVFLEGAATIFWNGPLGVAEWEPFAEGTRKAAAAIAHSGAYSVVGGGDSVAVLRQLGMDAVVSHLSTGGGAGLELIEKGMLPGIEALKGR